MTATELFSQLKNARLFGHPIHSMLVHFPSALFPTSLLFDILAAWLQSSCLACAGFYTLAAGVFFGFAASLIGAIDYVKLPASHTAWNKASLHALLSVIWLILFSIVFGLRLKQYPIIPVASPVEMFLSTIAVIGLIFSNFLGGDLIFKHRLGVDDRDKM